MNKKGNVWIVGLLILQIILVISTNFYLNLDHLLKINNIDPTFECVKIKVINRIKNLNSVLSNNLYPSQSLFLVLNFIGLSNLPFDSKLK